MVSFSDGPGATLITVFQEQQPTQQDQPVLSGILLSAPGKTGGWNTNMNSHAQQVFSFILNFKHIHGRKAKHTCFRGCRLLINTFF